MAIVEDFACTLCRCVCDDLRLTIENARIVKAERACALAEPWLLSQDSRQLPAARIEGASVPLDEGIARAAEMLTSARSPLIFGLSQTGIEGQRAALELADTIGATIDTTASLGAAATILAMQSAGQSTCTLGEVKNRCDLVIFWGCDPVETHPRLLERYAGDCVGLFVPGGRRDRTLVVVDVKSTATGRLADIVLQVEPAGDFELLWALRAALRGQPLQQDRYGGIARDVVELFYQRLKKCRSGVIFFGSGLEHQPRGHLVVEGLLRLVTELNDATRFYAHRLGRAHESTSAEEVMTWTTGYPFSVNLGRGFPRYNPGEFSANDMLERGEADVCLFVGSREAQNFSSQAMAQLKRIPTIALDAPMTDPPFDATVQLTTSVAGIHTPGTAYRLDGVPIPLEAVLPARYPTESDVLQALTKALGESVSMGGRSSC